MLPFLLAGLGLLGLVGVVIGWLSLYYVPALHVNVVRSRLTPDTLVLKAGWTMLNPWTWDTLTVKLPDRGQLKTVADIPMLEQSADPPPFTFMTKDRMEVKVDVLLRYVVVEPSAMVIHSD